MTNRTQTVLVWMLAAALAGCDGRSPSGPTSPTSPTGPTLPAVLVVTAITPNTGSTLGTPLIRISGNGFQSGASVTLDGAATSVRVVSSTTITAAAPPHAAGTVDVVVTNPSGQSSRLIGAFTYVVDGPHSLTPSVNTVAPGGQLSVSWTAPRGASLDDWIGFFPVGAPSTDYEQHWWEYTRGATSGTLTLAAPTQPGEYEFRYLLDNGYVETGRSSPVAVTGTGITLSSTLRLPDVALQ